MFQHGKYVTYGVIISIATLVIALVISQYTLEDLIEPRFLLHQNPMIYYEYVQSETTLYLWRLSTTMFIIWFFSILAHSLKPSIVTKAHSLTNGYIFTITHYAHLIQLAIEGEKIFFYPFLYKINNLYFIDIGLIVLIISIYQTITLIRKKI